MILLLKSKYEYQVGGISFYPTAVLQDVFSKSDSMDIASVCNILWSCVCIFNVFLGMTSEGIYRKSGVNSRVAALCERFRRDARSLCLREGEHQVDDVSNTLKRFFRELEEGLFTSEDASTWLSTAGKFHKTVVVPCKIVKR